MCQPLDGSHSVMTGDNRAHRISVILRKITAIHLVSDQYFPLNCFVSGQTTGVRDWKGRFRLYDRRSLISSFEHDLTSVFFHASALEQSSQRHPGPFCIADCAELPLCSFNLWDKKDATIACALQSGDPRLGGHVSQFLVAQRKRIPDRTIDAQLVRGEIELRGREMTAYVEQLCRSEKRVNLIEGSLQIVRLLLSNDQAHRRGLTSFLDLASGAVLLGIFHIFFLI